MNKVATDKDHHRLIRLLPWYVNETLAEEEASEVREHLAQCRDCQKQVREMTALKTEVADLHQALPSPSPQVFDAVMMRIEAYEAKRILKRKTSILMLRTILEPFVDSWTSVPRFARVILLAQGALIAALAITLLLTARQPQTVTLTDRSTIPSRAVVLTVAFQADILENEIRQLLLQINGKFLGGPSAQGFYQVLIPVPEGLTADQARERAVTQLRSNSRMVRFVEARPQAR